MKPNKKQLKVLVEIENYAKQQRVWPHFFKPRSVERLHEIRLIKYANSSRKELGGFTISQRGKNLLARLRASGEVQ